MSEEKKQIYHCARCGREISKKQYDEAIKSHWLPLCWECEPEIKKKFKQWYPKFKNMRL